MQKIQSLKELKDGAPDEVFFKPIRPKHWFHISQAHLRGFENEGDVRTTWTCNLKRVQ
jgi:hypothetical protein